MESCVLQIPQLTTGRLLLRGFRPDDFEHYAAMMADPDVSRHLMDGRPLTRVEAWRQLAMFAGGTWNLPILAQTGVDYGVAPFPYFEGDKVLTPTGSWYIGVSAASANQAEAFDFAKYLTTSDEGTRAWFKSLNQLPVSKPLLDEISTSADYDAFPQNVFRLGVYDSLNTAKARPVTAAYGQLQDAFRTAFVDMANGVAVKDALASAVQKFESAAARVAQ